MTDDDLLRIATTLGLPFGMLDTDYCESMGIEPGTRSYGEVTCDGMVRFARAVIAAAQPVPAVPDLKHCACEFDGDACVIQCKLHAAHVDAIHEWAERAKSAEARIAAPAVPDVSANLPGDMAIAEGAHQFMSRRYYNDETGRGWTEWAPYIPPKGLAKILPAAPAVPAVRTFSSDPECNYYATEGQVCTECGRIHRDSPVDIAPAAPAVREPQDDCMPNHFCNKVFVHLPAGEMCNRCGHEGAPE